MDKNQGIVYRFSESEPTLDQFAADVKNGLGSQTKYLKPKYFYDQIGSNIFEQICIQPEYYIARIESDILRNSSPDIVSICNGDISIVELGSGSSSKTRILLEHTLEKQTFLHYFPIDVSHNILHQTVRNLSSDFSNLRTIGISSDYAIGIEKATELITTQYSLTSRKLILFLGSSIGNFEPFEATSFLQMIKHVMDNKDLLLVGFDLQKEPKILDAAYNDRAEMTAKFNLNLLSRINRDLGGEFDIKSFNHCAFYNKNKERIEMHLISKADQNVYIEIIDTSFRFKEGESIHTENSYKYSLEQIQHLVEGSGFELKMNFLDQRKWFDLALLSPLR
jgi:L-histidine N-alpha-methyltransferase